MRRTSNKKREPISRKDAKSQRRSKSKLFSHKSALKFAGYTAAKFGVIGFSEALRSELKPRGIGVSVLCPPDTDTPGFHEENRTKRLFPWLASAIMDWDVKKVQNTKKKIRNSNIEKPLLRKSNLWRVRTVITFPATSVI